MNDEKQPKITPPASVNNVVVSCKLPNGLWLEVLADKENKRIQVFGSNHPSAVGGYGITPNVPGEFWDQWLKENKSLAFVENGFIFAHPTQVSCVDHAKEMAQEKNGLEPLPKENPAPQIAMADEMAKAA